jgi:hypothetical protein
MLTIVFVVLLILATLGALGWASGRSEPYIPGGAFLCVCGCLWILVATGRA